MWHYAGPEDSTRTNPECVTGELVTSWVRNITGACDNPRGARRVKPFRADNPPPNEAWTNWFSPVSNGNPAEEEEGSQEGSVESVEYVSDSGETEEESKEEEGEDEEQNSPPPPPEPRTKRRHEPVALSAPPASSSAPPAPHVVPSALPSSPVVPSARSTKRTRDSAAEPAGQPSKVAKPSGSKPQKALPRMRIVVPVASAVFWLNERSPWTREANKALVAEMEKIGKGRTELMGQMKVMNRRCISQEKYVSDWARKMIALLGDFCMDAEAEAADVERSVIPNVPLDEDANRDMLRAHIRLGKVGPFIGRLREVVGRIDKELWPEDESRQEMEGLMTRLEDVPNRVQAWKKSAARCGADVALSLVRVHCKEAREEKLKALQVANTKKL
ncbi:hypothetical protein ZWY2020_012512 [Hordeum vulgare]|nr:hypothetical protein ZWY2020_012512 [Hordeum vulgare]